MIRLLSLWGQEPSPLDALLPASCLPTFCVQLSAVGLSGQHCPGELREGMLVWSLILPQKSARGAFVSKVLISPSWSRSLQGEKQGQPPLLFVVLPSVVNQTEFTWIESSRGGRHC